MTHASSPESSIWTALVRLNHAISSRHSRKKQVTFEHSPLIEEWSENTSLVAELIVAFSFSRSRYLRWELDSDGERTKTTATVKYWRLLRLMKSRMIGSICIRGEKRERYVTRTFSLPWSTILTDRWIKKSELLPSFCLSLSFRGLEMENSPQYETDSLTRSIFASTRRFTEINTDQSGEHFSPNESRGLTAVQLSSTLAKRLVHSRHRVEQHHCQVQRPENI